MAGKGSPGGDTSRLSGSLDTFDFTMQQNKASLVSLHHAKLLKSGLILRLAQALKTTIAAHDPAEATAAGDYLEFERSMAAIMGGPEASLIHLGRSRQDMLSTLNRQMLRKGTLTMMHKLGHARRELLSLAGKHVETVWPTYTHGAPAQPTSFGHYLLSFAEAFERVHERFVQGYHRINRSPYGVAVGTNSRFNLDRAELAALLGFEGIEENSYGANHVLPVDAVQDAITPLVCLALHVAELMQDFTQLQARARPWLSVVPGPLTGISSAMPQKRNPRVFEYLREMASEVVGGVHMATIMAHNGTTGLIDVRETITKLPIDVAVSMLDMLTSMFGSVVIDVKQALYESSHDYSTCTQVADVLFLDHEVPFRTGHHFASQLAEVGREQGIGPLDIGYTQAAEIYRSITGGEFPLSESELTLALSPEAFVQSRKGLGGPQKTEVERMLQDHEERLQNDARQTSELEALVDAAEKKLEAEFEALLRINVDEP